MMHADNDVAVPSSQSQEPNVSPINAHHTRHAALPGGPFESIDSNVGDASNSSGSISSGAGSAGRVDGNDNSGGRRRRAAAATATSTRRRNSGSSNRGAGNRLTAETPPSRSGERTSPFRILFPSDRDVSDSEPVPSTTPRTSGGSLFSLLKRFTPSQVDAWQFPPLPLTDDASSFAQLSRRAAFAQHHPQPPPTAPRNVADYIRARETTQLSGHHYLTTRRPARHPSTRDAPHYSASSWLSKRAHLASPVALDTTTTTSAPISSSAPANAEIRAATTYDLKLSDMDIFSDNQLEPDSSSRAYRPTLDQNLISDDLDLRSGRNACAACALSPPERSRSASPIRSVVQWVASGTAGVAAWPLASVVAAAAAAVAVGNTVYSAATSKPGSPERRGRSPARQCAADSDDDVPNSRGGGSSGGSDNNYRYTRNTASSGIVDSNPSLLTMSSSAPEGHPYGLTAAIKARHGRDAAFSPFAQNTPCRSCETRMRIKMHEAAIEASNPKCLSQYIVQKLPSVLNETEYKIPEADKVFASAWLSDTEIAFGTKCSRLYILNIQTGRRIEIPSVVRTRSLESLLSQGASSLQDAGTESTGNSLLGMAGLQHCTGIHSIAINPARTLLAIGGGQSAPVIQIFRLPTLEPHALLQGHTDAIFSVAWITNTELISGSRDTTLMQWSVAKTARQLTINTHTIPSPYNTPFPSYTSMHTKKEHRGKVRDLVYDADIRQAFTLSSDGYVKIWDAGATTGCNVVSTVPLYHTNETVCMALDRIHHLIAIGSQSHISILDPRSASIVHMFESRDDGWGVRSLHSSRDVVTIGGGLGRISFYDMRARRYIGWDTPGSTLGPAGGSGDTQPVSDPAHVTPSLPAMNPRQTVATAILQPTPTTPDIPTTPLRMDYLQAGKGWLQRDTVFTNHFHGAEIRNAVYTIAYNPNGTKLFAAGGPLQLNLRGSYAGLWA